jgi:hypothetical protein
VTFKLARSAILAAAMLLTFLLALASESQPPADDKGSDERLLPELIPPERDVLRRLTRPGHLDRGWRPVLEYQLVNRTSETFRGVFQDGALAGWLEVRRKGRYEEVEWLCGSGIEFVDILPGSTWPVANHAQSPFEALRRGSYRFVTAIYRKSESPRELGEPILLEHRFKVPVPRKTRRGAGE